MTPLQRAVRLVLQFHQAEQIRPRPARSTLVELVAREIENAVADERESAAKLLESRTEGCGEPCMRCRGLMVAARELRGERVE